MKYYILLIYLLAFSLATEGNTAVKDSLSEALPSASSPLQKLEIMTNLMDLSRQEEQVEYAKQLYWLALEEDEDYYKEAALTEILRFYVNTDAKDSAKVYLAEAERELKGKARDFLVTYMKTIMDVRVVYYTKGEDRMKLIEKYKLRLETEKAARNCADVLADRTIISSVWRTATGSIRKTRMLSIKRYVIT